MAKYIVKGVKWHRGHEGEKLAQCTLLRDDKKVALYSDGDWGSESQYWWMDKDAEYVNVKAVGFDGKFHFYKGTPEESLLADHVASLPARKNDPDLPGQTYHVTPDIFVGELIIAAQQAKRKK